MDGDDEYSSNCGCARDAIVDDNDDDTDDDSSMIMMMLHLAKGLPERATSTPLLCHALATCGNAFEDSLFQYLIIGPVYPTEAKSAKQTRPNSDPTRPRRDVRVPSVKQSGNDAGIKARERFLSSAQYRENSLQHLIFLPSRIHVYAMDLCFEIETHIS
uniref:Uncharacterized protein n=1 Tax=Anopheles coluzzii TaxID=1518534 RepID=A0A8W7PXA5_ANOCL